MAAPRAILADDERLLREQLRARLAEVWPELEIVAEAKNGQEAVELVQQLRPDLAFLDIRMPGLTGVEAARAIGNACHIVFVTAYGEFAIEAFEQGAVDYVLKPAEAARLQLTVQRLKQRLQAPPPDLGALLDQLARKLETVATAQRGQPHLQWVQAAIGQQLRMIPVGEILFFVSDEKYTRVQTEGYEALIRVPIRELIDQLDPEQFWQIHRSTIVNVHAISGVVRDFRGRQLVTFKNHAEKLEVSRSFTHLFRQM
ncbi:MAG TPA: LytTR family DNA-binding domain-containing protein [Burkholderiaceae bacterium]|jgi:DNA-binding LytR/AlgR family response regulator|nr:LytTR family DNA-binding domain-containing protein [Burkholderiaceae bacterium]